MRYDYIIKREEIIEQNQAAELITGTRLKMAEIGTQCGFQEMSYFARTFRELRGCTPSE